MSQLPYLLGHSPNELERLVTQARVIDPITRRFFLAAGVAPGMRVLDIGSGAGDVAFLAAELVGSEGEVVGVDRVPTAIENARARAEARSLRNVSFREGDPAEMTFDRPFDAITGRYVLMFQRDPADMLRRIAKHVRRGGVIVFHEPDWFGARSIPPAPTYDRCCEWLRQVLERSETESHMGTKLHSTFVDAGLSAPTMGIDALIGGGEKAADNLRLVADLVGTVIPNLEQLGIATPAEIDSPTLAERMIREVTASGSVTIGRSEVGAWTRV